MKNKGSGLVRGQIIKIKIIDKYGISKWLHNEIMYIGIGLNYIKYSEDLGNTFKILNKNKILEIKEIKVKKEGLRIPKYIVPKLVDPIPYDLKYNNLINEVKN